MGIQEKYIVQFTSLLLESSGLQAPQSIISPISQVNGVSSEC